MRFKWARAFKLLEQSKKQTARKLKELAKDSQKQKTKPKPKKKQ